MKSCPPGLMAALALELSTLPREKSEYLKNISSVLAWDTSTLTVIRKTRTGIHTGWTFWFSTAPYGTKAYLDRTLIFLRGCAGTSDRRERKATPSGVFDWTQSGQSRAWGDPNQRFRNIQKDIPKTLLAYVAYPRRIPPPLYLRPQAGEIAGNSVRMALLEVLVIGTPSVNIFSLG